MIPSPEFTWGQSRALFKGAAEIAFVSKAAAVDDLLDIPIPLRQLTLCRRKSACLEVVHGGVSRHLFEHVGEV